MEDELRRHKEEERKIAVRPYVRRLPAPKGLPEPKEVHSFVGRFRQLPIEEIIDHAKDVSMLFEGIVFDKVRDMFKKTHGYVLKQMGL
jgi:hypothetical protein